MTEAPKVAESLTMIGEEYAIRGTMYRYGKWEHRIQLLGNAADATTPAHARLYADGCNHALVAAGREPDVQVIQRTIYAGEWEAVDHAPSVAEGDRLEIVGGAWKGPVWSRRQDRLVRGGAEPAQGRSGAWRSVRPGCRATRPGGEGLTKQSPTRPEMVVTPRAGRGLAPSRLSNLGDQTNGLGAPQPSRGWRDLVAQFRRTPRSPVRRIGLMARRCPGHDGGEPLSWRPPPRSRASAGPVARSPSSSTGSTVTPGSK